MIISINSEETGKIQRPFIIRISTKWIQREIPQHKGRIWQVHIWHHLQQYKAKSISFKFRNKTKMPTIIIFILVLEILATEIRQGKEVKDIPMGRKK